MRLSKDIENLKKEIDELKNTQRKRTKELEKLLSIEEKSKKLSDNETTTLNPAEKIALRRARSRIITQTIGSIFLLMVAISLMAIVVFIIFKKINAI